MVDKRLQKLTNDYIKNLQRAGRGEQLPMSARLLSAAPTKKSYSNEGMPEAEGTEDQGFGSWILEMITRPLNAVAATSKEYVKQIQGDPDASDNPFAQGWEGLTGSRPTMGYDVINEAFPDLPTNLKAMGGLAFDVGADPINLLAGGALSGVKAATKGLKTGKVAKEVTGDAPGGLIRAAYEQTPLKATKNLPRGTTAPSPADIKPTELAKAVSENSPVAPIGNAPRKARERVYLDNYNMNEMVNSATSGASRAFDAEIRRRMPGRKLVELDDDIRAGAVGNMALERLRTKFDSESAKGKIPTVKAVDGTEFKMSTLDIFESLPRPVLDKLQFGGSGRRGNLYPSQWHAGAAEALRADLLGLPLAERPAQVAAAMRMAVHPAANRIKDLEKAGQVEVGASALVDATPQLARKMLDSARAFAVKDVTDAQLISDIKVQNTIGAIEIGTTAQAINEVANVGQDLSQAARQIGATDNAAVLAAQAVAPTIAKVVPEADVAAARTAKNIAAKRRKRGNAADKEVKKDYYNSGAVIDRDSIATAKSVGLDVEDPTIAASVRLEGAMDRMLNPVRAKLTFGYGQGPLANAFRSGEGRAQTYNLNFRRLLADIDKKHAPDNVQAAYSLWRTGVKRGQIEDTKVALAYDAMVPIIDATVGNGLIGRLWRNGATVKAVNEALKEVGLKYEFVPLKKGETWSDLAEQPRQWDISDPLSDLEKINFAAGRVEAKQVTGRDFSRQFGSLTPKPGWIKLDPTGYPTMGDYLQPMYFDPEALGYMKKLEEAINAPTSFRGERGGIAAVMNNVVDPAMRLWKPFVTTVRPGHHARNTISDVVLNYMWGLSNPSYYKDALSILRAGRGMKQEGIQGLEALDSGPLRAGPDKLATVQLKGGKTYNLSSANAYQMMNREGTYIGYQLSEDFMEKGGKFTEKILSSKYMRFMGGVSEKNTAWVRSAQVLKMLKDPKFTRQFSTIEDATREAAIVARRWHSDMLGLTPFEKKYMRRVFPFYSWFRQALPLVALTLVAKPGRISAIPKAMYNASIAAGVNPNSLSDPFPTDRLYPSFVTDHLTGPVFGQVGMNLGSPTEAFLGDFGNGNVARNLLGMLNPVAKAPIELLGGESVGTGAAISDTSDYVDQLIPGVNQFANISGYSPTGLFEDQAAVAKGEKNHFANLQLLNFLTGVGMQNYDRPSYNRIAAREQAQG